jgi:putative inorganic carbon (hco3(-)) transporter
VDFVIFLLVNAVLFIRPQEIVADFPIENPYVLLIVVNLLVSAGAVFTQFSGRELRRNPLMVCVLGFFAAIVLSQLSRLSFGLAWEGGLEFAKVVVYYALLVSVVRTPLRLKRFIAALVIFTSVLSAMALLQYYGFVQITALKSIGDWEVDPVTGELFLLMRLCSTGVFHDPNDLACIVVAAAWMCFYLAGDRGLGIARFLWLTPLILFVDVFTKTHSRGGFLGLLGSVMVMFVGRFGGRKAIPLLALGLPVLLFLFAGRQTSISASEDTGQDRVQLWAEGFELLKRSPIFGIGWNLMADQVGLVAHNSFIHGYVELGLFGGPLFLALFAYPLLNLYRQRGLPELDKEPELARMRPYLMAIVAGYAVCLLTLSRNYVVPTYMIIGLAGAYLSLIGKTPGIKLPAFNGRLAWRIYAIGLVFLVIANLFTRTFVRYN